LDRAGITAALRDALEVVEEVLPRELPPGPRGPSAADRTELRKTALKVILEALLQSLRDNGGAPLRPPSATLRTSEAARMLGLSIGALYDWEKRGLLHPSRSPTGHRMFDRAEVEALLDGEYPRHSADHRNPDADMEDVARLRTEDRLSWGEIADKTGLTKTAAQRKFGMWADRRLTAGQPGTERPGAGKPVE
jgi:predicted DNA-binding transcriptional regulator AlpA